MCFFLFLELLSMNIALVQVNIEWENKKNNLTIFSDWLSKLDKNVDLVVLPEMFSTGFTMCPNLVAETMEGETVSWIKQQAQSLEIAIIGSFVIEEAGNYYNRLFFVFPDGEVQFYDKRHLFTLAGEEKVYTSNKKEKVIMQYKGWKICPLICYDLRFPVYSRNVEDYDLLLYVANWPKQRMQAWDILLRARAVENLSYVVGVNRVGFDANGLAYIGHSQVIDELGHFIVQPFEEEAIQYAMLDKNKILETRTKLNFLKDKDEFSLFL